MFFKLVINRAASYEHILGRTGFIWRATIVMCFASYSNAVRMFSIANAPIPTMTTFFSFKITWGNIIFNAILNGAFKD